MSDPSEVLEIANLMVPEGWRGTIIEDDVLKAAWRIYNAGFRKLDESIRQQERERCAKIADAVAVNAHRRAVDHIAPDAKASASDKQSAAEEIAARIRGIWLLK